MPTLFLATPCYGGLCLEAYAASVLRLQADCARQGIQLLFSTTENESLVQRARNIAAARFLRTTQAEFLMFIDADIHFEPHSVLRLLESGHDVVVACYPKRTLLWDQAAQRIRSGDGRDPNCLASALTINLGAQSTTMADGFVEVLDGPTGFMLIRRHVVESMYRHFPGLNCVNDHAHPDIPSYCAIFDCMIDPVTRRYLSEDYAFCRRWQQMGGKIHADVGTRLGHVGALAFVGCMEQRLEAVDGQELS